MKLLTGDTAVKLICCADAFEAMLAVGTLPDAKAIKLAIAAMREAIPQLEPPAQR